MQKFFELQEGEKILKEIKPLPALKKYFFVTSIIGLLTILIIFFICFIPIALKLDIVLLGMIFTILFFILIPILWLIARNRYKHQYYWITNKRVICKSGLLGYTISSVPFERISDIIISRSFLERILGFGSLYCQSLAGQIGREIRFQAIPEPEKIQKFLFDLVKKKRKIEHITF